MRPIERRVEKLEVEAGIIDRRERVHVLVLQEGADRDTVLKESGIEPRPQDLVVFIKRYSKGRPSADELPNDVQTFAGQ